MAACERVTETARTIHGRDPDYLEVGVAPTLQARCPGTTRRAKAGAPTGPSLRDTSWRAHGGRPPSGRRIRGARLSEAALGAGGDGGSGFDTRPAPSRETNRADGPKPTPPGAPAHPPDVKEAPLPPAGACAGEESR